MKSQHSIEISIKTLALKQTFILLFHRGKRTVMKENFNKKKKTEIKSLSLCVFYRWKSLNLFKKLDRIKEKIFRIELIIQKWTNKILKEVFEKIRRSAISIANSGKLALNVSNSKSNYFKSYVKSWWHFWNSDENFVSM